MDIMRGWIEKISTNKEERKKRKEERREREE